MQSTPYLIILWAAQAFIGALLIDGNNLFASEGEPDRSSNLFSHHEDGIALLTDRTWFIELYRLSLFQGPFFRCNQLSYPSITPDMLSSG